MNIEELENLVETATEKEVVDLAKAELQKIKLQEKAATGDALSQTLLTLKNTIDTFKKSNTNSGVGNAINKDEIKKLIAETQKGGISGKVTYEDLDLSLQNKLSGQVQVKMTLTTPYTKGTGNKLDEQAIKRPSFQKLLSDFKARNNVYLYGGAGTGKTYIVEQLAKFLGYDYVEVNCNQFTSPLDLVGGQTIEGYQKGKLEMAWTNVSKNGDEMKGAVLCLDELPKLDPNTAGVLNSALAKVKLGTIEDPVFIYNGKGEKIFKKNIFVIATGNTQLNEVSTDYEANFKQDLSLQDRFVGSTYEVIANYQSEFKELKDFAFIFIYMIKVREIIFREGWANRAFVSFRILISLRDTYIVSRDLDRQFINEDTVITSPKTIKQGIDSFLDLFSITQKAAIKNETNYDNFMNVIVPRKNKIKTIKQLNTEKELEEVKDIIEKNSAELKDVNE